MGETGDQVTVNVEKNKEEVNPGISHEEAKKKAERVKEMERLRMKLKTAKTKMTKNINKIKPVITLFEKNEKEGGSATRINLKAKEIQTYMDTLESLEIEATG